MKRICFLLIIILPFFAVSQGVRPSNTLPLEDSLSNHLDTLQILRTDINSNIDNLAIHFDTLQILRTAINTVSSTLNTNTLTLQDSLSVHLDTLQTLRVDINSIDLTNSTLTTDTIKSLLNDYVLVNDNILARGSDGDVNSSGTVNATDAVLAQFLFNISDVIGDDSYWARADFDGNGVINNLDSFFIQNEATGIFTTDSLRILSKKIGGRTIGYDFNTISYPQLWTDYFDNYKVSIGVSPIDSNRILIDSVGKLTAPFLDTKRLLQSDNANSIFIGEDAGTNDDLTDNYNTFVGWHSGGSNTTGDYNTAIGGSSLFGNTTGSNNTSIGYSSGDDQTTGSDNVFLGYFAKPLSSNEIGSIALGANVITNGSHTTTIGDEYMETVYIGQTGTAALKVGRINADETGNSVFIGYEAGAADLLENNTKNTFIGYYAGTSNTSGHYNTAIGGQAFFNNTTGIANTAIGNSSLTDNTTGNANTALGMYALSQNTEGTKNVGVGNNAIYSNGTNDGNTAIGYDALHATIYGRNTAIGCEAGSGAAGAGGVFIGYQAGYAEADSNRLYIANSSTTTPLIYGEFDNDSLEINGDLSVTGRFYIQHNTGSYIPTAYNSPGTMGQVVWGEDYIYICIQDGEWKRTPISTW